MTYTPKFHDPAFIALNKKRIDALVRFFPMEHCRDLVRLKLVELDKQVQDDDSVILPNFNEKELDDPNIPEEYKEFARACAGKKMGDFPLTPEQEIERLGSEAHKVSRGIVIKWLNVLYRARSKSGDKPVRLDSSLLPPPELTSNSGVDWDEALAASLWLMTAERIRELMALYAVSLIPVFVAMLANQPNGFVLAEDIIICQDAGGFYVQPKTVE